MSAPTNRSRARFVRTAARSLAAGAALGLGAGALPARAQGKAERVTLRYGYLPVPTVPLFAAVAHELLEKENFDLQLIKFTSGPASFQALQAGSIDAAQGGMPTYYMGSTRGLDVRWVYTYGDYAPIEGLIVPPKSTARSFADLRGKRITAPSGSMMHLALLYALKREGMTLKDVEFVPLQPPQGMAAILNADVDGGFFWDPFVTQAVDKGARRLMTHVELGMPDPFGFAVNTRYLADPRNVQGLARMMRAMGEGQQRFAKDPEPTLNSIKSIAGIDRPLATHLIKGVQWYTLEQQLSADGPANLADPADHTKGAAGILRQKVEDLALEGGLITRRGNITEFLDNRAARAALGK